MRCCAGESRQKMIKQRVARFFGYGMSYTSSWHPLRIYQLNRKGHHRQFSVAKATRQVRNAGSSCEKGYACTVYDISCVLTHGKSESLRGNFIVRALRYAQMPA